MTQEDIIRMAREAGLIIDANQSGFDSVETFAALVAAASAATENEACAKVCDHILKEGGGTWGDAIRARGQA
jgi:hypothetical protein